MVVTQLHLWLGVASAFVAAGVGLEGAWRALGRLPPGPIAERLNQLLLLVVVVAGAGGLGLFVGGARPAEPLHFVYAIVALGILPLADSLSRRTQPRARGIATVAGALVALIVIFRLFETG